MRTLEQGRHPGAPARLVRLVVPDAVVGPDRVLALRRTRTLCQERLVAVDDRLELVLGLFRFRPERASVGRFVLPVICFALLRYVRHEMSVGGHGEGCVVRYQGTKTPVRQTSVSCRRAAFGCPVPIVGMGDSEVGLHPEVSATAEAIAEMDIRGAATIADAAAGALATQAAESDAETAAELRAELTAAARLLHDTRPTAVSLPNALRYVLRELDTGDGETSETSRSAGNVDRLRERVVERARTFRGDLEHAREELGRIGAGRLRDGDVVMTHCHSTDALAVVEAAVEQGTDLEAIVKETRPRNQGHLTARQLSELGVPVTLVVDNAAHQFLNDADHVLVGADSIAADGSVVNKIGTSGLAVSARDRGVPIVVAAQTIKLHPGTLTGTAVEIEERAVEEVVDEETRRELGDVTVRNPAFDVTPPRHVDAIVTEHGQFPPESVVTLMRERFGTSVAAPWE